MPQMLQKDTGWKNQPDASQRWRGPGRCRDFFPPPATQEELVEETKRSLLSPKTVKHGPHFAGGWMKEHQTGAI